MESTTADRPAQRQQRQWGTRERRRISLSRGKEEKREEGRQGGIKRATEGEWVWGEWDWDSGISGLWKARKTLQVLLCVFVSHYGPLVLVCGSSFWLRLKSQLRDTWETDLSSANTDSHHSTEGNGPEGGGGAVWKGVSCRDNAALYSLGHYFKLPLLPFETTAIWVKVISRWGFSIY